METETPPEQFQQQLEADVSPLYQQVEVNCFLARSCIPTVVYKVRLACKRNAPSTSMLKY